VAGVCDQRYGVGQQAVNDFNDHETHVEGDADGKRRPEVRWRVSVPWLLWVIVRIVILLSHG
jgi:hypothetical protein